VSARDLLRRKRRFLIAVISASLVFSLMLVLDGLLHHIGNEVSRVVDRYDADVWIVAPGESGPFTANHPAPGFDRRRHRRAGGGEARRGDDRRSRHHRRELDQRAGVRRGRQRRVIELTRERQHAAPEVIARIPAGRYFGELAPIFGLRRSATARAVGATTVRGCGPGEFWAGIGKRARRPDRVDFDGIVNRRDLHRTSTPTGRHHIPFGASARSSPAGSSTDTRSSRSVTGNPATCARPAGWNARRTMPDDDPLTSHRPFQP
jgi:hypothetical protein